MFVAERMMSKGHYRYVHVWNEESSELQVNLRWFWKGKYLTMESWILIIEYWLSGSLVPRRLIRMNVSGETFDRVFARGFTDGRMESVYYGKSNEMKIIMGMFVSEMKWCLNCT